MQALPLRRRELLAGLGAAAFALSAPTRAWSRESAFDWTDIELLDANNRRFTVDQSAQPLTLIKLWANWCTACMRELDSVANIAASIGPNNIDVILVSHPDDWALNQQIAQSRNLSVRCARPSSNNPQSVLSAGLLSSDGTFYVPRSMLFSRRERAVVWSHVGGVDWDLPSAVEPIRRWVG